MNYLLQLTHALAEYGAQSTPSSALVTLSQLQHPVHDIIDVLDAVRDLHKDSVWLLSQFDDIAV
jgi:hypothetical protein